MRARQIRDWTTLNRIKSFLDNLRNPIAHPEFDQLNARKVDNSLTTIAPVFNKLKAFYGETKEAVNDANKATQSN